MLFTKKYKNILKETLAISKHNNQDNAQIISLLASIAEKIDENLLKTSALQEICESALIEKDPAEPTIEKKYDYRSLSELSSEECEQIIRNRFPHKKIIKSYPAPFDIDTYKKSKLTIDIKSLFIEPTEYLEFFKSVDYISNFPNYYRDNLYEKSLEHFVAFTLLNIQEADVVLDVAAEGSPIYDICKTRFNAQMFRSRHYV